MQNQSNLKPLISLAIAIALIFCTIMIIGKVLIPFLIALSLAYILNPLIIKMQQKIKINRNIACGIFSILIGVLVLLIPIFVIPNLLIQIKIIITKIPEAIEAINIHILKPFNDKYNTSLYLDLKAIKAVIFNNAQDLLQNLNILPLVAQNGIIVIESIVYMILIPFILFYTLLNWQYIINIFNELIPRPYFKRVNQIMQDIDTMLSAYLRGQILVMIIMASYYGFALNLINLQSGIVIGIITGLLVFIPYIGILTGFVLALLLSLAQFSDMHSIVLVMIAFGLGHIIEGALVTPFLVGGKLGINPIMIILALMVFGQLFGLTGVLLALPLSAISIVLFRHARICYLNSSYYGAKK